MKKADISIIVCTYNRAEMLRHALESLICQKTDGKFSYEVVVVDNASTDSTKAVVRQVATNCSVPVGYILEDDKGVAAARNRGVKESQGAWIAFFDDDQWAERDWLKNLICTALEVGAVCVAGTIQLALTQEQLSRLGPECRATLGEYTWHKKPETYTGKTLPGTGNILIARKVFDSIGLFDTSMSSGEDTDFLLRTRAAGFDIWTAPNALIHHLILPYRLEPAYFRWDSLKSGSNLAKVNCKQMGRLKTSLLCLARIGQALLVNLPYLLLAYLKSENAEILDRKCLLWRAVGYTRRTMHLLAPELFPQTLFFDWLDFRKRKSTLAGSD